MNARSRSRRLARRRAHARGDGALHAAGGATPDGGLSAEGRGGALVRCQSAVRRVREAWGRTGGWVKAFGAVAAAALAGLLAGPAITPGVGGWARVAGSAAGAATALSVVGVAAWRRRLGTLTAIAAVATVWGGVFAAVAALSPTCPGGEQEARCSVEEVATWGMLGLLTPLAAVALVSGPVAAWLACRAALRAVRRRDGGRGGRATEPRAQAKREPGTGRGANAAQGKQAARGTKRDDVSPRRGRRPAGGRSSTGPGTEGDADGKRAGKREASPGRR